MFTHFCSKFHLFFLLLFFFSFQEISAQQYPVQANVQVIPPYSVRLSDYCKGNNQKLLVNITLKDLQRTDLSVRLRIRIKGQGIELVSKDDFTPKQQIILQPGAPELIYGDRLEEYLSPDHLIFSGITKSEFLKTGRLPEGIYQFSVEVLEIRRKEKLSNTASTMAWLLMNEPPKITSPVHNKVVKATDPASIFFTWIPRHMNSMNTISDVMYEFTMVEIWPVNQSVEEAIRSKEPLLKENFNFTSFVYDAQYPALEPGRKYACRVRAYSEGNKEMFKNDGYSQVVCFTFGQECKVPQAFMVEPPENGSVRLSVIPEKNHTSYNIQIRDLSGDKWYGQEHSESSFELDQLRIGSSYECKMQAQCGSFSSDFTPVRQFIIPEEIPEKVECGQGADIPVIDGSDPLTTLEKGDKINAGGFEVLIKEATGSGNFSGKGVVRIGMLGNIELRTVFDDIQVNQSYQLTAGEIKILGSDIYVLSGDIRDKADEIFEDEIWQDIDQAIANAEEFSNLVKEFQKEVEDIKLNQDLSEAREQIEKGRDMLAGGDPEGAELVQQGSDKVDAILDQINSGEYQITTNGIVFIANDNQKYGFDNINKELTEEEQKAYRSYYKVAEVGDSSKTYYTKPWKSIGSHQTDNVSMEISLKAGMSPDTLHFINGMGTEITPIKQGNNYTLTLKGKGHEEVEQITAYYNVWKGDSLKKKHPISLAALNVISYDDVSKTVVLVPVNGNRTAVSVSNMQKYLNSIYKSANVKWKVETHSGIQVEYSDDMSKGIADGKAGLLSNYTGEMNKVISALKRSGDFDKNKEYLLLMDKSQTKGKQGFMPKKRPYGFIFTDYINGDKELYRTAAHELGHGIFRLTHNFDDFANIPQQSTQNLMDYAGGTQLRKFQWNDIHNLRDVEWWGQDVDENASVIIENANLVRKNIELLRFGYVFDKKVKFRGKGCGASDIVLGDGQKYDEIMIGFISNEDIIINPRESSPIAYQGGGFDMKDTKRLGFENDRGKFRLTVRVKDKNLKELEKYLLGRKTEDDWCESIDNMLNKKLIVNLSCLPDESLKKIKLNQKISIIELISDEQIKLLLGIVNSIDQKNILPFFKQIEKKGIIQKMKKELSKDNYMLFVKSLVTIYYKQDLLNTWNENIEADNLFVWYKGIGSNGVGDEIRYDITFKDSITIKGEVVKWVGYGPKGMESARYAGSKPLYSSVVGPFELVAVEIRSKLGDINSIHKFVPMPAFYFEWLCSYQNEADLIKTMDITLTAISFAFGIGELRGIVAVGRFIFAVKMLGVFKDAISLVLINEELSKMIIKDEEDLKTFMDYWSKFCWTYDITTFNYKEIYKKQNFFANFGMSYNVSKEVLQTKLDKSIYKELDNFMREVNKRSKE